MESIHNTETKSSFHRETASRLAWTTIEGGFMTDVTSKSSSLKMLRSGSGNI